MNDQISLFGENKEEHPSASCYECEHFAEFKEPRRYSNRDGEFGVFGMCFRGFNKNGSYTAYNVYIPAGRCKNFQKKRRHKHATT